MSAMKRYLECKAERLVKETGCEYENALNLLMGWHSFEECKKILSGDETKINEALKKGDSK